MDGMAFVHIVFRNGFVLDGFNLRLLVLLLGIINAIRNGQYHHDSSEK